MDPFLVGEDLKNALTILPSYNDSIRSASKAERLLALNNIFDVYYPSMMAAEIYSKLYLAYVRAWQKKNTITAIQQGYENRKAAKGQFYKGIIGGCDSFTIIGKSGIGKSSAIERAVSLITGNELICIQAPHIVIIPILQASRAVLSSFPRLRFPLFLHPLVRLCLKS